MQNMRISVLLSGIVLLLASCQKETENTVLHTDFTLGDTLLKVYENLSITNLSDSTSVVYNWDFGDGVYSTEKNPVHNYATPGDYIIKLKISDNNGNIDSTHQHVRVGDRFVYEIVINSLAAHKWYPGFGDWDEDSTGVNSLPDVFFSINEYNGSTLYETGTVYNVGSGNLPLVYSIQDLKISPNGPMDIGGTGFYLVDRDGTVSESMASNMISGVSCSNDTYDKTNHTGEFTIEFYSSFTVKYKIR
jgi:hypothetical protein